MAILTPDTTTVMNGVPVNEYLLTKHNPNHIDMPSISMEGKVMGVTVHNTEWISVASNTTPAEQYTRATVNGNMKDVRVHYYVDHKCAWQNLPLTLTGWHAADGSGNGNRRTIAIECIMSGTYNDTDKASEDNCARLAATLLKQFSLGIDSLYTHTHWLNVKNGKSGTVDFLNTAKNSYKNCPLYILPHWYDFKAKVQSYLSDTAAPTASPLTSGTTTEKEIYDYFRSQGFSDFAVAGIMGNLYAESALLPNNLQNTYNKSIGMTDEEYTKAVDCGRHDFVHDSAGYGLAQWTYYSRKQELLNFAKVQNASIGDAKMQCAFLVQELKSSFKSVFTALLSAGSVREASDVFLTGYEKPADQSEATKQKRASFGQGYYDKYKSAAPVQNETKQLYRVRKSWEDSNSQIGAFSSLENAKNACTVGYTVFDTDGNVVYTKVKRWSKGDTVTIADGAPLFASAEAVEPARNLTGGTYYIYDGIVQKNGRYRITIKPEYCGNTPIGMYVTGYVSLDNFS